MPTQPSSTSTKTPARSSRGAVLRPELFAGAMPGRFPLLPLLERAREAGRLGGQRHRGAWLDVGTPERLARLDAELQGMRG
jgi:MurNAc alpha-1-phosphate uridylyltransferase